MLEIDGLRKLSKDYPELPQLETMWALISSSGNPVKAKEIEAQLPEADNRQRWQKYEFARLAGLTD